MEINDLKAELQGHFTDGLAIIVGCGLSSAEGIPGMEDLSLHLQKEIPKSGIKSEFRTWDAIFEQLSSGKDIESVLLENPPDDNLEKAILDLTADLILSSERKIIEEVINGRRTLRFSKLLNHVLKPNTGVPIITTNYDRLIEVACERARLAVDTLFVGYNFGTLNPKESRMSFCRNAELKSKQVRLTYQMHATVLKPHGSLDWYVTNNEPLRCPIELNLPRLIITPGLNKYRTGYDRPFDSHRERANKEIDRASRYLIIGYGFNDKHLETHLNPHLQNGKPAVLITRDLTENALQLLGCATDLTAIFKDQEDGITGTRIVKGREQKFLPELHIWDLNNFVKEVFDYGD